MSILPQKQKAQRTTKSFCQSIQVLSSCQGIYFQEDLKKYLFRKHKIVSKNVGVDKSTKNMKDFLVQPFLLDRYSVAYLLQVQSGLFQTAQVTTSHRQLFRVFRDSLQFKTFCTLKQKYFLISGHKFGCQLLAYQQDPSKNHAEYLVFCGQRNQISLNFNHMTRLTEIGKKKCLFANFNDLKTQVILTQLERKKQQISKRQNKISKVQKKEIQKTTGI